MPVWFSKFPANKSRFTKIFFILICLFLLGPLSAVLTGVYEKYLRTGTVKRYFETGELKEEAEYQWGKRQGLAKTYFKSGKLKDMVRYVDDMREGEMHEFYENGEYKGEDFEIWLQFQDNLPGALKSETLYRLGQREGILRTYYESGAVKKEEKYVILRHLDFFNGKPTQTGVQHDIETHYYESGEIDAEIPYKIFASSKNGAVEYDAKVHEITKNMIFSRRHGIAKYYNEDGSLSQETTYDHGEKRGQMKVYRNNGTLFATFEYDGSSHVSGRWTSSPVSGICHNRDGTTTPFTNAQLTNWDNGLTITCN